MTVRESSGLPKLGVSDREGPERALDPEGQQPAPRPPAIRGRVPPIL